MNNNTSVKQTRGELREEIETLREKLHAANRIHGRDGATIHVLRAELEQVRAESSRIERAELRRLGRENQILKTDLADAIQVIRGMRETHKESLTLSVVE